MEMYIVPYVASSRRGQQRCSGNQLTTTINMDNFPGFSDDVAGVDFMDHCQGVGVLGSGTTKSDDEERLMMSP